MTRWQVWASDAPKEYRAVVARWVAGYHAPLPGAGLRLLRECMSLTRPQLAAILGIAERRVARWENQADDPMAERVVRSLYLASVGDEARLADVCLVLELQEEWPAWLDLQGGRVAAVGARRSVDASKQDKASRRPPSQARRRKISKPRLQLVGKAA